MGKNETLKDIFVKELKEVLEKKLVETKSDEEVERILQSLDVPKVFQAFLDEACDHIFHYMKLTMYEEVLVQRSRDKEFIAHQEQIWNRAFVASEAMYIMALEAAESYSEYVSTLDEDMKAQREWTFMALQHIHGRALQEFLEVITLLKNGFADGAYARWRSMYELSVIAAFIKEHGESVARKFYEASETDDRYDWAKVSGIWPENKKHINFSDIEKSCTLNTEDWKNQYVLANRVVHASPQGTFARLGNTGTHSIIPAGRSDYGITTPGEHSAISLAVISALFFTVFPETDTVASVNIINRWVHVIRETYFKAHDEAFPDDEKMWDDELCESTD